MADKLPASVFMTKTSIATMIILLSIAFTSCSQDQKFVEWLGEGEWSLISFTVNGVEFDSGGTLTAFHTYNECKVKEADCSGYQEYILPPDLGFPVTGGTTFLYRVHEKGTKITITTLTMTFDGETRDCTVDCVTTWDILEMEEDIHVIIRIDDDGDTWIKSFEKI